MGTCLNVLNDPEHFLLAATLIVLVLLVWAQLYASGRVSKQDKNVNWRMGLFWTYLAMFFALVAVATLFLNSVNVAKGFLILSLLMAVVNIVIALLQNFIHIFREGSIVGTGDSRCERIRWSVCWVFFGFGLGILSFGYVLNWACPYEWFGFPLVIIAVLYEFLRLVLACCSRAKNCWKRRKRKGGTVRRWLTILY